MLKKRMFSTSIQFTEEQFKALEKIKKTTDRQSNSEIVREAFDFYIENQKKFIEI